MTCQKVESTIKRRNLDSSDPYPQSRHTHLNGNTTTNLWTALLMSIAKLILQNSIIVVL